MSSRSGHGGASGTIDPRGGAAASACGGRRCALPGCVGARMEAQPLSRVAPAQESTPAPSQPAITAPAAHGARSQLPAGLHRCVRPLAGRGPRPGSSRTWTARRRTFDKFGGQARDAAKDATGAIMALPNARVVTGRERCAPAPNGAPDCQAAADTVCKGKGFQGGKSLDTVAEAEMPGAGLSRGARAGAAANAGRRPTSRARSASDAFPHAMMLPARARRLGARRESAHRGRRESPRHAARARGRRPSGDRRADRRRQVRHHVPVAGAADARHARRRRCRSRRRTRPQRSCATAGWPDAGVRGHFARRRAQDAPHPCHARCRGADRLSPTSR